MLRTLVGEPPVGAGRLVVPMHDDPSGAVRTCSTGTDAGLVGVAGLDPPAGARRSLATRRTGAGASSLAGAGSFAGAGWAPGWRITNPPPHPIVSPLLVGRQSGAWAEARLITT